MVLPNIPLERHYPALLCETKLGEETHGNEHNIPVLSYRNCG